MDDIDNRNLETLVRMWNEYPKVKDLGPNPRDWWAPQQRMVLLAMRKAGDEALFDRVTVKLERSFVADRSIDGASREAIDWLEMEALVFQTEGKTGNAEMATRTAALITSLQRRT